LRFVYLASVWIHVLAATIWVGGLFFIALVLVPWMRAGGQAATDAAALLRDTGGRLRTVAWLCFALLLATGTFNLWVRGVRPGHLVDPAWWTSPFGSAVGLELLVFALVLIVSLVHDFRVGPRATDAMAREPGSPKSVSLRRQASLLGRLNAILALILVGLGVVIVRGWPW
jgi:uncharacterized membrane protein